VGFLPNRCLAAVGDIHTDTQPDGGGGLYEVRRLNGLWIHNIHTKFHEDWFRHSEASFSFFKIMDVSKKLKYFKYLPTLNTRGRSVEVVLNGSL
jgi:hypothetical protein